ncbi:MAG: DUF1189 family protein [Candidatus Pacebacteria bacterium]|nr:DUF1189 family protein [Candidatus Paceibacterota bacterium]MBP9866878.1 DUF1189 family protein [Candidatus Paceibacterota bacterium]
MNFLNAFWNPSFYKNNTGTFSFWKAFLRLLIVSFFIGIVYATLFYVKIGKDIPTFLYSFDAKVSDGYPNDLVISIKDEKLSKNIPGEIKLYPVSMFGKDIEDLVEKNISHFIVIDDTKEATVTSFEQSGGLMFFAKDGFLAKDSNNKISISSYEGMDEFSKDITFSKEVLTKFLTEANEYIPSIPKIITITIVIVYTLFVSIWNAFYLLFVALLVMVLSIHIIKRKVTFGEAYILSMYALPSLILLEAVLSYIPYVTSVISFIPFFTTIGICLFLLYMFKENNDTKKHGVASL